MGVRAELPAQPSCVGQALVNLGGGQHPHQRDAGIPISRQDAGPRVTQLTDSQSTGLELSSTRIGICTLTTALDPLPLLLQFAFFGDSLKRTKYSSARPVSLRDPVDRRLYC